jgi:hypothetical protein
MAATPSIDMSGWLHEQLAQASPDLLRAMVTTFAEALMSAEADAVCGAPFGVRSSERTNTRNGYRAREWDTRAASIELAIPKLRSGTSTSRPSRRPRASPVNTLIANPSPGAPVPPILQPLDGFLFLDREKFPASFAADVSAEQAAFMADSHVPWGVDALGGSITEPAWRGKPSWYLVTTEDRMIPPQAQRSVSERAGSTVAEVSGSHSIYVSQPAAVASLIEQAAAATTSAGATTP